MVDTPATQQLRNAVATRLEGRLDELVDAVCSAVFAAVGPYQQLALPGAVSAFRADVRGSLDVYVRTVRGHPLTDDDLARVHGIGAARARQGMAAEVVTDALEVAMRTCWQYVREATLAEDDPQVAADVIAELAGEAFRVFKELAAALAAGHAAETGRGTYSDARSRAELVARLVDGTWSNEQALRRTARSLGVDLGRRWTLFLLTPADPGATDDLERQGAFVGQALPDALVGAARAAPMAHLPVLVPGEDDDPAAEVVDTAERIAAEAALLILASDAAWGWTALPHVYRGHVDAIVCARAAARAGRVVREAECAAYRLLRGLPLSQRVAYVRSVLGPVLDLPPAKAAEALETLDGYFRGRGRLDETAADLHLHRNSFRYRLDRAQTILGVSFRNSLDRMRVELALAIRKLDKEETALLDGSVAAPGAPPGAGGPAVG